MTPTNEQLAFFNGVAYALRKRTIASEGASYFHWPVGSCFDGSCGYYAISDTPPYSKTCNWKHVQNLAFEFFNNAPDVSYAWKLNVSGIGLNPDDFHEILLGVFVSGESYDFGLPTGRPIRNKTLVVPNPKAP